MITLRPAEDERQQVTVCRIWTICWIVPLNTRHISKITIIMYIQKGKMFSWWFFKYIINLLFLINVAPSTNSCSDDDTTCDYYSSDATSSTSWWFLWKNIGKDNEYFFIQNCLIIPKPSNSFFLYLIFIILELSEDFWLVLLLQRKYLCLEKWWMHYVVSVNNLLTID